MSSETPDIKIKEVDVNEARKMIAEGAAAIDIRDALSYQSGRISDATHLTKENLQSFLASADRSRIYICYCYHGNSSRDASLFLQESGLLNCYSLKGGYEAWSAAEIHQGDSEGGSASS